MLKVFSLQGHSGFSAPYAINYFTTLANHKPLTPIQGTEEEWFLHDEIEGKTLYQNKRQGAIFKDDENNVRAYYLDALVWSDEDISYTGDALLRKENGDVVTYSSRQFIKFPFTPKTFYIDVVEEDGEFYIKDENQLNEALKYFNGE